MPIAAAGSGNATTTCRLSGQPIEQRNVGWRRRSSGPAARRRRSVGARGRSRWTERIGVLIVSTAYIQTSSWPSALNRTSPSPPVRRRSNGGRVLALWRSRLAATTTTVSAASRVGSVAQAARAACRLDRWPPESRSRAPARAGRRRRRPTTAPRVRRPADVVHALAVRAPRTDAARRIGLGHLAG